MIKKLFSSINDNKLKVIFKENSLNIINYKRILIFDDDKIKVDCPQKIISVMGNELSIKKLFDEELLIMGNIKVVKLEDNYE